jgi:hypothetical protein
VLTVDNQQQIDERTGGTHGNKGVEAAISAIKMISLKRTFAKPVITPGKHARYNNISVLVFPRTHIHPYATHLKSSSYWHESSTFYTLFCRPVVSANGFQYGKGAGKGMLRSAL